MYNINLGIGLVLRVHNFQPNRSSTFNLFFYILALYSPIICEGRSGAVDRASDFG